ncbi:MAG: hypothetical protein HY690_10705 [Chloroflexi bacterium]|nr:hypothetical protein [Chloroflexota bacterium]
MSLDRIPQARWLWSLVAVLALAGCQADQLLAPATPPPPGAAATAARAAATPIPTPIRTPALAVQPSPVRVASVPSPAASPVPPEQVAREAETVVASIGRALASQNLAQLEPILLDEVAVAAQGSGGETMPREKARTWLAERLGPGIKVEQWRRVELYDLVEVVTERWPQRAPLSDGRITFNLHRFNSRGQQDGVQGEWKIDVIIAE